jgi:hypothetical protein
MLEDEVTPHPALYCNFLTAAGRAGNLGFARYLYQHMAVTLELPQPQAVHTCGLIPTAELQQQQQQQQQQAMGTASSPTSSSNSRAVAVDDAEDGFGGEGEGDTSAEPELLSLVNALLNAHAQVGAMQGAVAIYRQELLGRGLRPDGYTCTALLTAAARLVSARLAWSQVADVVELTHHYGITLSTQLGTALINAYRRVRCWEDQPQQQQQQGSVAAAAAASKRAAGGKGRKRGGRPEADVSGRTDAAVHGDVTSQQQQQQQQEDEIRADAGWEQDQLAAIGAQQLPGVSPPICAALHAAQQVLLALQQHKLATSNSYVTMMCFLLEQGQVSAFKRLYEQATGQFHIGIDEQGWEKLAYAAAESGAGGVVANLQQQTQQVLKSQQQQQQEMLQQQRLRARQQQLAQQQQQQQLASPVAR